VTTSRAAGEAERLIKETISSRAALLQTCQRLVKDQKLIRRKVNASDRARREHSWALGFARRQAHFQLPAAMLEAIEAEGFQVTPVEGVLGKGPLETRTRTGARSHCKRYCQSQRRKQSLHFRSSRFERQFCLVTCSAAPGRQLSPEQTQEDRTAEDQDCAKLSHLRNLKSIEQRFSRSLSQWSANRN